MKRNIDCIIVAMAIAVPLALFAPIAAGQTIDFGQNLPSGPVPAGYAGFDWGSAVNDPFGGGFGLTNFSASIDQFSRSQPFDFNSVTFQNFESEAPGDGAGASYTTVISGYLNNTLVSSLTENYGWASGNFSGLNIDDVNKITFATKAVLTDTYCCDSGGNIVTTTYFNGPDATFISSLNVSGAKAAPEIDPASAASGLTLLLGGVAVLRGRRRISLTAHD
jgi:hypothetical protein